MLSPLDTRAHEILRFAQHRRRVMCGVNLQLALTQADRRGIVRQQWRRVLEIRQVTLATDYAIFLLTR